MRIANVVGTRPNIVKMAPLLVAQRARAHLRPRLIHTGQHADEALSARLFDDLGLPAPDVNLGVERGGGPAALVERIVPALERELRRDPPDLVVVVGDVSSTAAAAIAARRCGLPVAHVEAGLRSGDRSMPEEANRILTDGISRLHFATEPSAVENLLAEGADPAGVHLVGNVLIDALVACEARARLLDEPRRLGLHPGGFAVLTLHRPANVDDAAVAAGLVEAIAHVAARLPVVFPLHPRTRAAFARHGLDRRCAAIPGLRCVEPLGYVAMLSLTRAARIILTDSGGLQEETSFLGVPCLTLRDNTERPITVTHGLNHLAGRRPDEIVAVFERVMAAPPRPHRLPACWDGRAAERIVQVIERTSPVQPR